MNEHQRAWKWLQKTIFKQKLNVNEILNYNNLQLNYNIINQISNKTINKT